MIGVQTSQSFGAGNMPRPTQHEVSDTKLGAFSGFGKSCMNSTNTLSPSRATQCSRRMGRASLWFGALLAAVCCAALGTSRADVPAGAAQPLEFQAVVGGGKVQYVVSALETDALQSGNLAMAGKNARRRGVMVAYEKGAAELPQNRCLLLPEVMVKLQPGMRGAGLASLSGVQGVRIPAKLDGFLVLEFPDASAALAAVETVRSQPSVASATPVVARPYVPQFIPNDTLFVDQWHLLDTGKFGPGGIDVRVTNVWETFRGEGITIKIIDQGTDMAHEDLAPNMLGALGYDFLDGDGDASPMAADEAHGTAVSGVAAAAGNNALGVAGAAFRSGLIPVRLIGGPISDEDIANAFLHQLDSFDVCNNSWGPGSLGGTRLAVMGDIELAAFEKATSTGRGGRGSVFVFSAGNDAEYDDNSNYSQENASVYVITVGAIGVRGAKSVYSEPGASTVVSSPSNDWDPVSGRSYEGITTTDITGDWGYNSVTNTTSGDYTDPNYTKTFSGTSSAAPLVSGVAALVLQSNPELGWRDVQEILMTTATKVDPKDSDWITNGAGFHFNHKYGGGMANADAAVAAAQRWLNLGPRIQNQIEKLNLNVEIPDGTSQPATVEFDMATAQAIRVEHAELTISVAHPRRGDLSIVLVSPEGTRSRLYEPHFDPNAGIDSYRFKSVLNWGESSSGVWKLEVRDTKTQMSGSITYAKLVLSGSDAVTGKPDGVLEVKVNPAAGQYLFANTNETITISVADSYPVTNATVRAKIIGGTGANGDANVVFQDNGRAPDLKSLDGKYTANIVATNPTSLTLQCTIIAPGKTNYTNSFTYPVVVRPPNDLFANAIKVAKPALPYTYGPTSNRGATNEVGEPAHGGNAKAGASLWWTWTAPSDTQVLVDTYGSGIDTVLGVYTGTKMSNLVSVLSVDDVGAHIQAFGAFQAKAGITYYIAVASANASVTGTIQLSIVPGAAPDTTPPIVRILSPTAGQLISSTSNLVSVVARATDEGANASGVDRIFIKVALSNSWETFGAGPSTLTSNLVATLTPGTNRIQVAAVDLRGNESEPVFVDVLFRQLETHPDYDNFAQAALINPAVGSETTNSASNVGATMELGEPKHDGKVGGASIWFVVLPDQDGVLSLRTEGSSIDTLLALYTGTVVSNLTKIVSNDDAQLSDDTFASWSKITQPVRANEIYYVAVDGLNGATGAVQLVHSFTPIKVYDLNITSGAGGTVSVPSKLAYESQQVTVQATPSSGFEFDYWQGAKSTDSFDPFSPTIKFAVTSDVTLKAMFKASTSAGEFAQDGFESAGTNGVGVLSFTTDGWMRQSLSVSSGSWSLRSKAIGDSGSTWVTLSQATRSGLGSFDLRVSSEEGFDFLEFWVDGALVEHWSGIVDWKTYQFAVAAGTHVFKWVYSKDSSSKDGLDAAFIDNVRLPLPLAVDPNQRPSVSILATGSSSASLVVTGQTGQSYAIQVSTDLVQWQTLFTGTASGGVLRYTDTFSSVESMRFYRAVVR